MKLFSNIIFSAVVISFCGGNVNEEDQKILSDKADVSTQYSKDKFTSELLFNGTLTEIKDRRYFLQKKSHHRHQRDIPLSEIFRKRFRKTTTTNPPSRTWPTTTSGATTPRKTTSGTTTLRTTTSGTTTLRTTTSGTTTPRTTTSTTTTTSFPFQSTFNNPHFFPKRSGIVHLFEWKYSDIAQECEDYLGPKGFAGVQTSPPTENLIISGRPWYERYQPISYKINTRSGDASDFLDMAVRCNNVGVRIYPDVVLNHMTGYGTPERTAFGTGGSYANPSMFYYPGVPYTAEDFHQPTCVMTNPKDPVDARNCEIVGHDLDQSRENVRWSIILLLNKLIVLGATGFRVGASKHMWPEDLEYIYNHVKNLSTYFGHSIDSRPFIFQEVEDEWKFNYTHLGAVTEFAHPINMADIFKHKKDVIMLKHYGDENMQMLPSEYSLTFVDSHDLQRQNPHVLTYKNRKELIGAYVFTLGYPYGIPRIMSSFEFINNQHGPPADFEDDIISPQFDEQTGQCINGWICEHRWNAITNMIEFRNLVGNAPVRRWINYEKGILSFCRGNKGFILINTGERNFIGIIHTCLPKGIYCDIISGKLGDDRQCTGRKIKIGGNGKSTNKIELLTGDSNAAIVLHTNAKIN